MSSARLARKPIIKRLQKALRWVATHWKWQRKPGVALLGLCALLTLISLCESELADRFASPLVAWVADWRGASVREAVMVVRIGGTQASDDAFRPLWPLSFKYFDDFIIRSWCFGARGVFIDVAFTHTRGAVSEDALGELSALADHVALISGKSGSPVERAALFSQVCRSTEVAAHPTPAPMAVVFARPLAAETQKVLADFTATTAMRDSVVGARQPDEHGNLPVAYRMADHGCEDGNSIACNSRNRGTEFLARDTLFTPGEQRDLDAELGIVESRCLYRDQTNAFAAVVRHLHRYLKNDLVGDLECPPILTVNSGFFMGRSTGEVIAAHASGKVMVLGGAIPELGDTWATSAHASIHGFYLIAESIDQLLTGRYPLVAPWSSFFARFTFLFTFIAALQLVRAAQLRIWKPRDPAVDLAVKAGLLATGIFVLIWCWESWLRIDEHVYLRDAVFILLTCELLLDPAAWAFQVLARIREKSMTELTGFKETKGGNKKD